MNQDQTLQDILEIVQFLKDNMVSKEDHNDLSVSVDFLKDNMVSRDELDIKLTEMKSEIMGHIDVFIGLHQKLDTELTALRSKYDRLESHIQQLAKHLQLELQ